MRVGSICAVLVLCLTARAFSQDLLPHERPIEDVVDHYVEARLLTEGVTPAPVIDDAAFLRRVTLDLAGRVPLASEVQAFLESTDPGKRVQLVDRLLASPDFAFHQRN